MVHLSNPPPLHDGRRGCRDSNSDSGGGGSGGGSGGG